MAKKKRKVPGLNGSSLADISFILLIFFLVTTSMDTDTGLARRLPPPPDPNQQDDDVKVKGRNVFVVSVNMNNEIMGTISDTTEVIGGNGEVFGKILGDKTIVDTKLTVLGAAVPVVVYQQPLRHSANQTATSFCSGQIQTPQNHLTY